MLVDMFIRFHAFPFTGFIRSQDLDELLCYMQHYLVATAEHVYLDIQLIDGEDGSIAKAARIIGDPGNTSVSMLGPASRAAGVTLNVEAKTDTERTSGRFTNVSQMGSELDTYKVRIAMCVDGLFHDSV
jgi:hypothetical protein